MFGFEILDVVIGLIFVYLLLALFATALNEYIAAVLNLRGKELARGLGHLLDDLDEKGAVKQARDGISARLTTQAGLLTEQLYNHRLIRPFATRQGWMTRWWRALRRSRLLSWLPWPAKDYPRLPSYIPARTFALALLDVLGVDDRDASLEHLIPTPAIPNAAVTTAKQALTDARTAAAAPGANKEQAERAIAVARAALTKATLDQAIPDAEQALQKARDAHAAAPTDTTAATLTTARQALAKVQLAQVLSILKLESPLDLTEQLVTLGGLSTAGNKLAADLQLQLAGALAGAQTQLQELHDGVEVWFNNAMDRVSGAYKRTAQGWLFFLGILIAGCMNADTIDMWRRLQEDDALRAAMVRRAEAMVADYDSARSDSAAAAASTDTAASARAGDVTQPQAGSNAAPGGGAATQPTVGADSQLVRVIPSPIVTGTTPRVDNPAADSASASDSARLAAVKQARENYRTARARLDSMELTLGWTREEAIRVGLLSRDATEDTVPSKPKPRQPARVRSASADSVAPKQAWVPAGYDVWPLFFITSLAGFLKLVGLLLTAVAISLGAPFWFDLLNKVISIRAAGRSPEERPKSPEANAKRLAERAPK